MKAHKKVSDNTILQNWIIATMDNWVELVGILFPGVFGVWLNISFLHFLFTNILLYLYSAQYGQLPYLKDLFLDLGINGAEG